MKSTSNRFAVSFAIFIVGAAILIAVWWLNGAERDDLWLYLTALWLVLYAAYEVFVGVTKRKNPNA